jgi:hypothetical protein
MKRKQFEIRPGQVWCLEFTDKSLGETWYYIVININKIQNSITLFNLYTGDYKQGKLSFDNGFSMLKDHKRRSFKKSEIYWKLIC